ncbi:amino acid racemase [Streptosporangium sp. NPDC051022]|uniref:aspartate/glutamate racemase family protein n=1 Tax=Streptosporangium sp. NPDC051022 TaxID=3155752 RepID=UPI0034326231
MTSRYHKTIGIIGGLGPLASANFYRCLVEETRAGKDQEHPRVVFISDPAIPSRLDFLEGRGDSPVPALRNVAKQLVENGADLIVLPSVTTHAFYEEIVESVPVPVVNLLEAITTSCKKEEVKRVAIALTSPARNTGLLSRYLNDSGIQVLLPEDSEQDEVQAIVNGIKKGQGVEHLAERLSQVISAGWTESADTVLIGCTDISPLAPYLGNARIKDVAQVLATAVLGAAEMNS